MNAQLRTRLAIGTLGVAMGAFGALRFFQLGLPDMLDALLWLAGGVVIHDGILAPLTIALVVVGTRIVRPRVRAAVTVGLVVLATVTITAIPVLGRFGARPDNPTLLPRNYLLGWVVFAVLVAVATTVAAVRAGRTTPRAAGSGDDRDGHEPDGSQDEGTTGDHQR